jgi:hypothetical protein
MYFIIYFNNFILADRDRTLAPTVKYENIPRLAMQHHLGRLVKV